MEKEIKITPPEGYEIDKENSTFECIKFKLIKPIKPKRFIDDVNREINGYYINCTSNIIDYSGINVESNYNIFATKKLAKAALAIARISQIRKCDKRFTELKPNFRNYFIVLKRAIDSNNVQLCVLTIDKLYVNEIHRLICFNTKAEANLFLEENKELLLDYFTIND